ncbi:MAG TPA: T9SS type A sorting domain-containing protein [Saprospiraceae bacterium]|nr:T9SS type A sorting domain-containing protein [Saprospiraceae bacterium]
MYKLSFLLIILNFINHSFGQDLVWRIPIDAKNVQLETPKSVVLDSMVVDIPENGKVIIQFEGNAWSSFGDDIIVAANEFPLWTPDNGNYSFLVYDSIYNLNAFYHSRIVNVSAGKKKFYAIGHNWTGKAGDGIASFKGNLTAEFYKANNTQSFISSNPISKYPLKATQEAGVLSKIEINAPKKGKLLVSIDGVMGSNVDDVLELTSNTNPNWPNDAEKVEAKSITYWNSELICHKKLFSVEPGIHTIYALIRKTKGDTSSQNNSVYCQFYAEFLADVETTKSINAASFEKTIRKSTDTINVYNVDLDLPSNGKLILKYSARLQSNIKDQYHIFLADNHSNTIKANSIRVQNTHINDNDDYFMISEISNAKAGKHSISIRSLLDPASKGTGTALIKGVLSMKFIGEKSTEVSSINQDLLNIVGYPVPFQNKLTLQALNNGENSDCNLYIFNEQGNLMFKSKDVNLKSADFDLSNFPTGIYNAIIECKNQKSVLKLVKQ